MHGSLPSTGARGCHALGKSTLSLHYAGEQFESTKNNTPKLKFGTSLREASEKIFISTEHEKSGYAACLLLGRSMQPPPPPSQPPLYWLRPEGKLMLTMSFSFITLNSEVFSVLSLLILQSICGQQLQSVLIPQHDLLCRRQTRHEHKTASCMLFQVSSK